MMETERHREWFVVRVHWGQDARAISALANAGIVHLDPEYDRRRPLLAGNGSMAGKVFPGHIFVAVDAEHSLLRRPSETPGLCAVYRDEKGRPMCIRPECIAALELYCTAASPGDVPQPLHALDLLHDGDRLDHFLDYCWGPPETFVLNDFGSGRSLEVGGQGA